MFSNLFPFKPDEHAGGHAPAKVSQAVGQADDRGYQGRCCMTCGTQLTQIIDFQVLPDGKSISKAGLDDFLKSVAEATRDFNEKLETTKDPPEQEQLMLPTWAIGSSCF